MNDGLSVDYSLLLQWSISVAHKVKYGSQKYRTTLMRGLNIAFKWVSQPLILSLTRMSSGVALCNATAAEF